MVFVITGLEGSQTHKSLKRLKAYEITIAGLQIWDKAELVRTTLARHRKSLNESGFGNQVDFLTFNGSCFIGAGQKVFTKKTDIDILI